MTTPAQPLDTLPNDELVAIMRETVGFLESVIRSGEAFTETVAAQRIDADAALSVLAGRLQDAEQRAREWEHEANLSKWPKEAASEYHRMKADLPVLERRLQDAQTALRRYGTHIDGCPYLRGGNCDCGLARFAAGSGSRDRPSNPYSPPGTRPCGARGAQTCEWCVGSCGVEEYEEKLREAAALARSHLARFAAVPPNQAEEER